MKVVAVIPARGGSKGIPNKNIRLLNGKPLIYYSVNNAKESRHISEVIISSDSKEVELIAKQMGVTFKNRVAELCQDDTTLDAVVYDAVKDMDCDIVITMKPTSPTLQTETLDRAIEYFLENDLDTLIANEKARFVNLLLHSGSILHISE